MTLSFDTQPMFTYKSLSHVFNFTILALEIVCYHTTTGIIKTINCVYTTLQGNLKSQPIFVVYTTFLHD